MVHPDGYVEIRDRIKDVIISGGENISSVEVEGVLLRHPAVQEVAVVGMPDEKWGEAPHAFVVFKPGADRDRADELRAFVRERLAHFKCPHSCHVRHRAAEDGDRKDPEVRAARSPPGDLHSVAGAFGRPVIWMPAGDGGLVPVHVDVDDVFEGDDRAVRLAGSAVNQQHACAAIDDSRLPIREKSGLLK